MADRLDTNHPPDSLDISESYDIAHTERPGAAPGDVPILYQLSPNWYKEPSTMSQFTVLGASADPTQLPVPTAAPNRMFALVQLDGVSPNVEAELAVVAGNLGHVLDAQGHIDPQAGLQVLTSAGFIPAALGAELQAAEPIVAATIAGKKLSFFSLLMLVSALAPIFIRQ